jgi:hypothetical protein
VPHYPVSFLSACSETVLPILTVLKKNEKTKMNKKKGNPLSGFGGLWIFI